MGTQAGNVMRVHLSCVPDELSNSIVCLKYEILSDKKLRVKYRDNGTTKVILYDFTNFDGDRWTSEENYRIVDRYSTRAKDRTSLNFDVIVRGTIHGCKHRDVEGRVTAYPHYAFLAPGEAAVPETETQTVTVGASSFREKRRRENRALREWKEYMREMMTAAAEWGFYSPTLYANVGKMLRIMDQYLYDESNNPSLDPLVVALMAEKAIEGPRGPSTIQGQLRAIDKISFHGTRTESWVRKGPPDNRTAIVHRRATNLARGNVDLPIRDDHDAINRTWIKMNRDGVVTLSDTTPTQGEAITASLTDPDGNITNKTVQWYKSADSGSTYAAISGATSESYSPVAADVGAILQARYTYDDNADTGNTANSVATGAVASS